MSRNGVKLPDVFPQEAQGPHAQVQSSVLKAMWNLASARGALRILLPTAM